VLEDPSIYRNPASENDLGLPQPDFRDRQVMAGSKPSQVDIVRRLASK
jgi:hypothetical protein